MKSTYLFIAVLAATSAWGKRAAPAEVVPVVEDGIRFTAPASIDGESQHGGFVIAEDAKTGAVLWKLRVYETKYDSAKERDVQDVFITNLRASGRILYVRDELDREHVIDVRSHRVIGVHLRAQRLR